ncbi:S1C family serine protease [Patescibacteria group bacterium]
MEQLTRSQFILLVLLVSFVTSVFTGIVTATLVTQAPAPITQTVSRVIEKTIETVSLDSGKTTADVVIVTQEDLIVNIVENYTSAVVSVVASKDIPVIEQYFINPFQEDEFFNNIFPPGFLPEMQVPQYRQKGTERVEISSGTGFFVSEDGYLLTNKHVVADQKAEYTIVMNDGRSLPAIVMALDPFQDLAVLKIKPEEGEKFNHIPFANSDKIKVGQTVIAIGNTLGEFQNTVSIGIVSGIDRTVVATGSFGSEKLQRIIQTDAAVNPGNSGGPLLDLEGKVIGINTAVAQGAENVGFALPINIAKKNISDLKEFGEIREAYFGVRYTLITDSVKKELGIEADINYGVVLIKGPNGEPAVIKDSPADKAGFQEGDIILEFNGQRVDKSNILAEIIANVRVGREISIKFLRDRQEQTIITSLDEKPENL